MTGLEFPNMGRIALSNWVVQATTQIMTFGFNDIDKRFTLSRRHFTPKGWEGFYKAMSQSGFIENIMASQQMLTAVPAAPPVLLQEGLIEGKYSWVYEMQMLVTFRSGSVKRTIIKTVRVVIEKVPTSDNPNGIGIGEWSIY